AATADAAGFFYASGEFGAVREGLGAALTLLTASALADIANLSRRAGGRVRGRWIAEAELQKQVAALPAAYEQEERFVRTALRDDPATAIRYLDETDTGGLASYVLANIARQNGAGAAAASAERTRSTR